MSFFLLWLGGILVLSMSAQGVTPPASLPAGSDPAILKTLRPNHPRLVALQADIDRVRRMIRECEQPRQWHEALVKKADKLLGAPPVEYKLIGPRLLQVSRDAVERIYTLGLLYRLDGDKRYAERGVKELLAISAFEDWHPSHFLDTAEMTHAAGVGYDWFYGVMTPAQRGDRAEGNRREGPAGRGGSLQRRQERLVGQMRSQLEPGLQRRDWHRGPGDRR